MQIVTLSLLWAWGLLGVKLPVGGIRPWVLIMTCLLTQACLSSRRGLRFEPKSALISGLSLTLLLRGDNPAVWVTAAVLSIGSKFWFRAADKHIWNPTNFGIAVTVLLWDGAWMSSGAWGQTAVLGYALAGFCGLTFYRTARGDVTWAVILVWTTLLFARAAWLGDPWSIPRHQLLNGSFWIFAFLMISDPKTLPDARPMRVLYGTLVAGVAWLWTFVGYHENGWIWALFMLAPIVPWLDRLMPAARYRWTPKVEKEKHNENSTPLLDPCPSARSHAVGSGNASVGFLWLLRRGSGRRSVQQCLTSSDRAHR